VSVELSEVASILQSADVEAAAARTLKGIRSELFRRLPAATPKDEGDLRRAWSKAKGPRGQLRIVNPVDYAGLVIPGRRRSRKSGRMLGSQLAPKDVVVSVIDRADPKIEKLLDKEFGPTSVLLPPARRFRRGRLR